MAHTDDCVCCKNLPGSPKVKNALHRLQDLQLDTPDLKVHEYVQSPAKLHNSHSAPKTAKAPKLTIKRRRKVPFPFLKLPAEIRNMIYGYCLVDKQHSISIGIKREKARRRLIKPGDFTSQHGSAALEVLKTSTAHVKGALQWRLNTQLCVQLLRVNKQISNEATTILYAQNLLSFLDPTSMLYFLDQIGDTNMLAIRRISLLFWDVRVPVVTKYRAFVKLIGAVNLESLALEGGCLYSMTRYSNSYPDAMHFYQMAQPWLWAVAGRTGSKEAPLALLHLFGHDGSVKQEGNGKKQSIIKRAQTVQVFRQLSAHFVSACEPMYQRAFLQTIRFQMA